jgi:hypothetical protein
MMIRTLTLVIGMIVLSAGSAAAQWQESLRNAVYNGTGNWRAAGWDMIDFQTGTLYDNYSTDLYVTLQGGVEYRFVGKCDANCSDLDFEIFDSYGNSIDTDYGSDDTPVVSLTPRYTTRFRLHVMMASCSADFCGYAVGMFR